MYVYDRRPQNICARIYARGYPGRRLELRRYASWLSAAPVARLGRECGIGNDRPHWKPRSRKAFIPTMFLCPRPPCLLDSTPRGTFFLAPKHLPPCKATVSFRLLTRAGVRCNLLAVVRRRLTQVVLFALRLCRLPSALLLACVIERRPDQSLRPRYCRLRRKRCVGDYCGGCCCRRRHDSPSGGGMAKAAASREKEQQCRSAYEPRLGARPCAWATDRRRLLCASGRPRR